MSITTELTQIDWTHICLQKPGSTPEITVTRTENSKLIDELETIEQEFEPDESKINPTIKKSRFFDLLTSNVASKTNKKKIISIVAEKMENSVFKTHFNLIKTEKFACIIIKKEKNNEDKELLQNFFRDSNLSLNLSNEPNLEVHFFCSNNKIKNCDFSFEFKNLCNSCRPDLISFFHNLNLCVKNKPSNLEAEESEEQELFKSTTLQHKDLFSPETKLHLYDSNKEKLYITIKKEEEKNIFIENFEKNTIKESDLFFKNIHFIGNENLKNFLNKEEEYAEDGSGYSRQQKIKMKEIINNSINQEKQGQEEQTHFIAINEKNFHLLIEKKNNKKRQTSRKKTAKKKKPDPKKKRQTKVHFFISSKKINESFFNKKKDLNCSNCSLACQKLIQKDNIFIRLSNFFYDEKGSSIPFSKIQIIP